MNSAATRGQPRALAEVESMILGGAPHALLIVGPGSIGKTTLALDLAAGLLCRDADPGARPCRVCLGCHLVASGNHPDVHRVAPEGPGREIRIGDSSHPDPGTVRHLIGELALLPAEGGARVAIVEQAHRLNEEAQNAFLKMLEEPPAGVTIVLCADDEERLLPTVRSRCVRVLMSAVGGREIERWLGELGFADAPRAARLARLADGRPGLALAFARSPDAERLRGEIARGILDMLGEGQQARLASVRELMKSAVALDAALAESRRDPTETDQGTPTGKVRSRKGKATRAADTEVTDDPTSDETAAPKLAPAARRSAAATVVGIWSSIARDLAVVGAGGTRHLRELELVDDLRGVAPAVSVAALAVFLARLTAVSLQLDENVNPELALDVLALTWPRLEPAAAVAASPAGGRR
jgi:DNA polymerase-3 subunit delta'